MDARDVEEADYLPGIMLTSNHCYTAGSYRVLGNKYLGQKTCYWNVSGF